MNILLSTDLDAQFRRVMDLDVSLQGEEELRGALQSLMAELLARQDLRQNVKLQSMLLACRLRLRALQNFILSGRSEPAAHCRCELRSLAEDLCRASDLLLRPLGRFVRFDAPEERIEAMCAPRDISWLILELICNAARHTRGEEIAVGMVLKRTRRGHPAACVLTVESAGGIDLEGLHACAARPGSGSAALLRTAWLHHGALLWLAREGKSVAAFRMPLDRTQRSDLAPPQAEDFVELLSDPCSQVYVALAQAVGAAGV